jgi:hypothetical protein
MILNRPRRAVAVALALAGAIVVAACSPSQPPGTAGYSCTTSIGSLPDFRLTGSPYQAVRPGPSGVTIVEVGIAQVQAGNFDFVLWDVLDDLDYDPAPDTMTFYVEENPTVGTASTVLKINVYDWTPTGTYELKVRGLAYEGSFFDDDTDELVGECFARFALVVLN